MNSRSNPLLRRFWFPASQLGIGVTAYSETEALELARAAASTLGWELLGTSLVDVDVRNLDEKHVVSNMGTVTVRGVWFPNLGS